MLVETENYDYVLELSELLPLCTMFSRVSRPYKTFGFDFNHTTVTLSLPVINIPVINLVTSKNMPVPASCVIKKLL